ncbi:hypothetical protein SAMN05518672_105332 [Chitinophaga sp. CF118]|uniref:hypothetical protein n=1 Tax=Chitinophaga sp. CF118 TaxID=1884367 RepID=UPI0008E35030|nr:hypothetical protein [Chitinophaga sp. CF118]SFE34031.1 hypothetical protein SAMN05518672_105332 [Chitinophaga sp. CF118]
MHYYQVSYLLHEPGNGSSGHWYLYDSTKPYNPNTLKDLLRSLHHGAAVTLIEPLTELTKEKYDELKRLLTGKAF